MFILLNSDLSVYIYYNIILRPMKKVIFYNQFLSADIDC